MGGREGYLRVLSRGARGHKGELDRQSKLSCAERAGKVSTDRLNSTKIHLAEQQ